MSSLKNFKKKSITLKHELNSLLNLNYFKNLGGNLCIVQTV